MDIELIDTDIYSYELLNNDISTYKNNFENNKIAKLTEIDKSNLPVLDKLEKMKQVASETLDNIQPILIAYFNGKLYRLPQKSTKNTISRVKGGGKFQIGQQVRMQHNGTQSEIYTVADNNKVLDANKTPYSPSVLTKKFHCEVLGNTDNGWDMAGLSHKYWVAIN